MKAYRVYDNQEQTFVKIGKSRSNDIYVNKELLIMNLKRYYNLNDIKPRFDIFEYDLVKTKRI
jgi:hypothetical protein